MKSFTLNQELKDQLVRAFLSLETEEECYALLEDLFTIREVKDLAQRLEVARLLRQDETYAAIVQQTRVSTATIGRVNRALNYGRGAYDLALKRAAQYDAETNKEKSDDQSE